MKTLKIFTILAMITGVIFTSCKKDSVNSSASSLSVKIQATNKTFSLQSSVSPITPVFVGDTAFIYVSRIELEAEKSDSIISNSVSEVHFEWQGPKKVDLFNLNSVVGDISLQPGLYHEVSIKIRSSKADAGSSLVFYLSGNFTDTVGSVIPIVVIVNEDFEFKVKKEGFTLNAISDYTSLINMDLNLLLSGILTSGINSASLTNGKVIISNTSNTILYNEIITNLSLCENSEFEQGRGSDSGNGSGSGHGNDSGSGH